MNRNLTSKEINNIFGGKKEKSGCENKLVCGYKIKNGKGEFYCEYKLICK